MGNSTLINTTLPPSQEFSFFGRIRRLILGRRGKFNNSFPTSWPINQKIIPIDYVPGELIEVAMNVPLLNTVISRGAEIFSSMQIKHFNEDGIEIKDSPILKFLSKPNVLQTQEQYLYEFYVMNGVYNKSFQHKVSGVSSAIDKIPTAMYILPSGWMKINATGKIYRQTNINDIIVNYEMYSDPTPFEVDKIIYMSEGVGNNILNPISRVEALKIPLANINAVLKSFNNITTEKGMIGMVSPKAIKDSDGGVPYGEKENIRIRKEYQNQYNLDNDNGHVTFPRQSMEWIPMTFPVKDLMLLEGITDNFGIICDAYSHDVDIYHSTKGATYENKSAGLKSTIQNGMQPLANKLMSQFTTNFVNTDKGEYLEASYAHLPCMKEDARLEAQGKLYTVQAASLLLSDGVIDHETYAEMCDVDMTGDKIIQPKQPINVPTPAPKSE